MRARRRRRGRWGPGGRGYGPGRGVSRSHGRIGPTDRSGGGGRRRWGGDGGRRIRRGRHAHQQVPRGPTRLRRSGWRGPPPRVPLPSGPALLEEGGEVAPVRWQGSDLPASRRTIARAPVGSAVPGGCREKGDRGSESDGRRSSRRGGDLRLGAPLGGPGAGGPLPPAPRELSSPPRSTPAWTRPNPLGRPSIWGGRTRGGPPSSKRWASGGFRERAPDSRASPGPSSSSRSVAPRGTRSGAGWWRRAAAAACRRPPGSSPPLPRRSGPPGSPRRRSGISRTSRPGWWTAGCGSRLSRSFPTRRSSGR